MIRCPRCGQENPADPAACARCGTPLALRDEPAVRPLDRELDLDRRAGARAAAAAPPSEEVPADFEPDRSDWRIGLPVERPPEPPPAPEWEAAADADEGEAAAASDDGSEPLPAAPARRVLSWAIDGALVAAAAAAIPLLVGGARAPTPAADGASALGLPLALLLPVEAFVAVVALVYATVSHALAGATLGKRLARIRVVGPDGRPPGFARSAARSAWLLASLGLAGLGLVPALLSPSGRALHDLLAGTRVVEEP